MGKPSSKRAYTYAVNQTTPGEGEGDDLLRKPSLWSQLSGYSGTVLIEAESGAKYSRFRWPSAVLDD